MAPEVVVAADKTGLEHDKAVDWWGLVRAHSRGRTVRPDWSAPLIAPARACLTERRVPARSRAS